MKKLLSTLNCKYQNTMENTTETFGDYVNNARKQFCREVEKQDWNTDLRTSAESMLIAYDQVFQKLQEFKDSLQEAVNGLEWHKEDDPIKFDKADEEKLFDWKKQISELE